MANETLYIRNIDDKIKKKPLKRLLFLLFSPFGRLLDVVALKTMRLRGQAWVVFQDVSAAEQAKTALNGFLFMGKPLSIAFSTNTSNIIKINSGTFYTRPDVLNLKRSRQDAPDGPVSSDDDQDSKRLKTLTEASEKNEILFITDIPSSISEEALETMFQQHVGFLEVRLVPGRSDIAFAEFTTPEAASNAKNILNGFEISKGCCIGVDFAKR